MNVPRKNGKAVLWVYSRVCYTLLYMGKTLTAIRIEQNQLDKLEKIAKSEDRSVSYLIRIAVEEFLKRWEKKEGK